MNKYYFSKKDFYFITSADELGYNGNGIVSYRIKKDILDKNSQSVLKDITRTKGVEICFESDAKKIILECDVLNQSEIEKQYDIIALLVENTVINSSSIIDYKKTRQRIEFDIDENVDSGIYRIILPPTPVLRLISISIPDVAYIKKPIEYALSLKSELCLLAYSDRFYSRKGVSNPLESWTSLSAREFGLYLIEMDFSEAILKYEEIAHYISQRPDIHMISFEIGLEIFEKSIYNPKDFERRFLKVIDILRSNGKNIPLLIITPYFTIYDRKKSKNGFGATLDNYRHSIERIIKGRKDTDSFIYYLKGDGGVYSDRHISDEPLALSGLGIYEYYERYKSAVKSIIKKTAEKHIQMTNK